MMSTIKRLLEENGYICTNKAKYADEYVKGDRVVYALPINSLNIVVAPDTAIGATWDEDAKEYHATSLRKFPKKMNKGATEINYGIQVRFNAENQMVKFLKELDCDIFAVRKKNSVTTEAHVENEYADENEREDFSEEQADTAIENTKLKKNHIRVSAEIKVDDETTVLIDDVPVSEELFNEYMDFMKSVAPDDEDYWDKIFDIDISIMEEAQKYWGLDYDCGKDCLIEYLEVYDPNDINRLKELYVGKKWKRNQEKPGKDGWINFEFKAEFVTDFDCIVTLPVKVDTDGVITDIKDLYAYAYIASGKYEVIPMFSSLVDAMDDATGKCPNLLYELTRMRNAMIVGDEGYFINYQIHQGMTLDEAYEAYNNME